MFSQTTSKSISSTSVSLDTICAVDEIIPNVLHPLILEYLLDDDRHENQYKYQNGLTFIANILAAYSTHISHNLLWNIKVDETLEFAKANPQSLTMAVEITDPHGQRVKGTPLKILCMAGDRNPRELKNGEKDYGLVERIRPSFSTIPDEYDRQLTEWFKDSKKASETTMAPYVLAIKTLCQQIIDSKEITDPNRFKDYLNLPMAEQFRAALTPDPKHVVTSGFLFDWQIFLDFFEIFEMNVTNDKVKDKNRPNLGGWWYLKSDVFDVIVYLILQARVQRCDLPHFIKGIGKVDEKGMPARVDFSSAEAKDLIDLGRTFFFDFYGDKCALRRGAWPWCGGPGGPVRFFRNLYQAKTSNLELQPSSPHSPNEQVCDNVTVKKNV